MDVWISPSQTSFLIISCSSQQFSYTTACPFTPSRQQSAPIPRNNCCGALQYPLASTASVAVHLVSAQLFSGLIWIGISMMENLFSTCRSIMAFTAQLLKIIIPFRLASQPSTRRRRSRTDYDCASARLIVCPHRMCLSCTVL